MKVDLITLHNVKNYGSALQTYASQKILQNLGYEVEVINYSRKDLLDENVLNTRIATSSIFSKNFFTKFIGKIFLKNSIKKQNKVFNSFLNENINLTRKYSSYEELLENIPQADIYCTGSDQVWNSDWNKGIEKAFFLEFVPEGKKRISYAASFGKNQLDKSEIDITREMLQKYDHISVREKSAKDIIENLGISNVTQVLDPTLLLDKNDWMELKTNIKYNKNRYILVYQLNTKNPEFDNYVKNLAKVKNMPIIRISNVLYQMFKYGDFDYCPSVNEFVTYFLNAEYIVTDSFHATAFSINFNKKFLSIFPKKFSTRLQSILELVGLEERRVVDYNDFSLIDREIDYDKVNKIIQLEREKSINYLKKALDS